jgi:hypothetical protein
LKRSPALILAEPPPFIPGSMEFFTFMASRLDAAQAIAQFEDSFVGNLMAFCGIVNNCPF